jgi:hypothetical protein
MTRNATPAAKTLIALGVTALLVSCVSPPGSYPDPNGPRNGAGFLVDPQSGVTLPGTGDSGGGGGGGGM